MRVLPHKYLSNSSILQVQAKPQDSPVSKGLLNARDRLHTSFVFRLSNGETSLWHDDWRSMWNIAPTIPYVDIHDVERKLCDLVVNNAWNLQVLYTRLPVDVLDRLQKIKPPIVPNRHDVWTWETNTMGIYTARIAYRWLQDQHNYLPVVDD